MKKSTKIIIVVSSLFLILLILFIPLYLYILYPSYLSMAIACDMVSEEELNSQGYYIAGTYNSTTGNITIYDEDPSIIIHENCHKKQFEQGRLFGCNFKTGLFLNEVECKIVEKLH